MVTKAELRDRIYEVLEPWVQHGGVADLITDLADAGLEIVPSDSLVEIGTFDGNTFVGLSHTHSEPYPVFRRAGQGSDDS